MRIVLVGDGGGAKGLIQAPIIAEIEERTQRKVWQLCDLVVGTSVFGIQGAILASGRMSADNMMDLMYDTIPKLMHRRMWPLLPKYSRQPLVDVWNREIGSMRMSECRTRLMTTSVSECDRPCATTHYFKSWEPGDGALPLLDVVQRTFAAPLYFGGLVDKLRRTVWLDGGTGGDNCPLLEALAEVLAFGWLSGGERVHILSLGTGWSNQSIPFERADNWFGRNTREARVYMNPAEGGLARQQSTRRSTHLVEMVASVLPQLTYQRLDCEIPEKLDKMDAVDALGEYVKYGNGLSQELDLRPFLEKAC